MDGTPEAMDAQYKRFLAAEARCDRERIRATPAASAWIHPDDGEPKTQPPKDGKCFPCLYEYKDDWWPAMAAWESNGGEEAWFSLGEIHLPGPIKAWARLDFTGAEREENEDT